MKNLNLEITTIKKTVGNLTSTKSKTIVSIHAWSTAFTALYTNGVKYIMPVTELEMNTSHTLRANIGDIIEFTSEEGGKVTLTLTAEGAQVTAINSKLKATVKKNEIKNFTYIAPITTDKFQLPKWW